MLWLSFSTWSGLTFSLRACLLLPAGMKSCSNSGGTEEKNHHFAPELQPWPCHLAQSNQFSVGASPTSPSSFFPFPWYFMDTFVLTFRLHWKINGHSSVKSPCARHCVMWFMYKFMYYNTVQVRNCYGRIPVLHKAPGCVVAEPFSQASFLPQIFPEQGCSLQMRKLKTREINGAQLGSRKPTIWTGHQWPIS